MRNEFTAQLHREGEWWVAFGPEVPEANGQGRTREACLSNLAAAIELVFEERRAEARKSSGPAVETASVTVG